MIGAANARLCDRVRRRLMQKLASGGDVDRALGVGE
jgi:hypothetical protein